MTAALSAAHCTDLGTSADQLELRGGATRWVDGERFAVSSYVNHPSYDDWTLDFDISILRTATQMTGTNMQPIPLPSACAAACCGTCVAGDDVTVAGWGITDVNNCKITQIIR